MDRLIMKETLENLQYFKDTLDGRRESEVVLISVENLNWLINAVDLSRESNKPNPSLLSKLKQKDKIIEELNKHNEALITENLHLKRRCVSNCIQD